MVATKKCVRCGEKKPFKGFPHYKQKYHGRKTVCHQCRECAKQPENVYGKQKENRLKYRAKDKGQFAIIKHGILRRGFSVGFSCEEYTNLVNNSDGFCHYCGVKLNRKRGSMTSRTMDRKDNNKGYLIENIVFACRRCNLVKSDIMSEQDMLEIAEKYIKPKLADFNGGGF